MTEHNFTDEQHLCDANRAESDHVDHRFPEWEYAIVAAYVLLICVGTVANGFVIAAMWKSKRLRISLNFTILHLACSDLCMCLVTTPLNLYLFLRRFWPFGDVACRAMSSAQALNTFIGSLTLVAISVCRLAQLSSHGVRRRLLAFVLLATWFLSLCLASPYWLAVRAQDVRLKNNRSIVLFERCQIHLQLCVEAWSNHWLDRRTYTLSVFAIQYLCPLTALLLTYVSIGGKLRARLKSNNIVLTEAIERKKKKLRWSLLLLISLVVCFAVCWLPNNLYHALLELGVIKNVDVLVQLACLYAGLLQTAINPILYGYFNENFKRVYVQIFYELLMPVCAPQCPTAHARPASVRKSKPSSARCNAGAQQGARTAPAAPVNLEPPPSSPVIVIVSLPTNCQPSSPESNQPNFHGINNHNDEDDDESNRQQARSAPVASPSSSRLLAKSVAAQTSPCTPQRNATHPSPTGDICRRFNRRTQGVRISLSIGSRFRSLWSGGSNPSVPESTEDDLHDSQYDSLSSGSEPEQQPLVDQSYPGELNGSAIALAEITTRRSCDQEL